MNNPYAVYSTTDRPRGVFGEHAQLLRGTFLFREIEFTLPFHGRLVYSGWWWTQTVKVNGVKVWRRISWKSIHPVIEFQIPTAAGDPQHDAKIEIDFSRTLFIMRFRLWIDDQLIYDEIN